MAAGSASSRNGEKATVSTAMPASLPQVEMHGAPAGRERAGHETGDRLGPEQPGCLVLGDHPLGGGRRCDERLGRARALRTCKRMSTRVAITAFERGLDPRNPRGSEE